jgi:hypothetical protein
MLFVRLRRRSPSDAANEGGTTWTAAGWYGDSPSLVPPPAGRPASLPRFDARRCRPSRLATACPTQGASRGHALDGTYRMGRIPATTTAAMAIKVHDACRRSGRARRSTQGWQRRVTRKCRAAWHTSIGTAGAATYRCLALEVSTSTACRSVLTPPGPGGHPSVGGS